MDRYHAPYEHLLDELERVFLLTEAAIRRGWARPGLHHALTPELSSVLGVTEIEPISAQRRRLEALETLVAEQTKQLHDRVAVSEASGLRLHQLRRRFGLDDLQVDIVVLALAPEVDPRFMTLFSYLQGAQSGGWLDVHIVGEILCGNGWERRRLFSDFDSRSPLVANHLVELMRTSIRTPASIMYRPIRANRALVEFAVGKPAASTTFETLHEETAGSPELVFNERILQQAAQLSSMLEIGSAESPVIVMSGREGVGKRSLLQQIGSGAGLRTLELRVSTLPDDLDACARRIREWLLRGSLYDALCYATETGELGGPAGGPGHAKAALLKEALAAHRGPVAVEWQQDDQLRLPSRPVERIAVPMPNASQQELIWRQALRASDLWVPKEQVQELAMTFHLPAAVIHQSVKVAVREGPTSGYKAIEGAVRNIIRGRLDELTTRIDRLATWDDLLVDDELHARIQSVVAQHANRHTVLREWDIGKRLRLNPGLSVLFWGPPGTGKSMTAGIIAGELGFELYQVDLAMVMSKWLGETEKNLARIFNEAEAGQVVLLFDEADSLFSKRTTNTDTPQAQALAQRVNYILTRLERFRGVAILTSNRESAIDDAFERRLSAKIWFPMPEEATRRRIWSHLLGSWDENHLDDLASCELAGGHVRNVCARAAFDAAGEGTAISMEHVDRALKNTIEDMGRLAPAWLLDAIYGDEDERSDA